MHIVYNTLLYSMLLIVVGSFPSIVLDIQLFMLYIHFVVKLCFVDDMVIIYFNYLI